MGGNVSRDGTGLPVIVLEPAIQDLHVLEVRFIYF